MPATNPILIHVGRGDIFINVPIPTGPPVVGKPPVPLLPDGSPSTGGRYVGSTLDAASLIWRPVPFIIRTQQATGPVGYVITEDDLRLEFHIGELSYENLRDLTFGALDQNGYIGMGGVIVPQVMSCMVVAPRRAGGYIQAMIYQSVFGEDRTFSFNRAGHQSIRVAAMGQSVTTRTLGDQLGYYYPGP